MLSPAGTITRTVYDGPGRPIEHLGRHRRHADQRLLVADQPAGTDMVKVSENEYDGGGIGDGNLTKMTPSSRRRDSRSARDGLLLRLAQPAGGHQGRRREGTEGTSLNRPIFYVELDNLGQVIAQRAVRRRRGHDHRRTANATACPTARRRACCGASPRPSSTSRAASTATHVFSVDPTTGAVRATA